MRVIKGSFCCWRGSACLLGHAGLLYAIPALLFFARHIFCMWIHSCMVVRHDAKAPDMDLFFCMIP